MAITTSINWQKERAAFPVCKNRVYLKSSATTPLRQEVLDATQEYSRSLAEVGEIPWDQALTRIDQARQILARLLGGQSEDFAFGANTSHNMNLLAQALIRKSGEPGEIVTLSGEFPSSVTPWRYHGYKVIEISLSHSNSEVVSRVLQAISGRTSAVVVSSVQFVNGFRLDIESLGVSLHKKGIPFIVNATQSFSALPIHLERSHISALTASSHKWMGAFYGCSLLFTSKEFRSDLDWPMAGHMSYNDPEFTGSIEDPKSSTSFIELGTPPFVILISVLAALREIERIGIENISQRILTLSELTASLAKRKNIQLESFRDENSFCSSSVNSGIIALKVSNPKEVVQRLEKLKIFVSERRGSLRVACHYFNNEEEIHQLFNHL
ncbi:aminotransferase class V-fold PLP-dependent enzyme [Bdellovibrionales bacterium]|nr:aminotransferase class V-fold PLP-dependent enzyme [Bdellovibrionales bacterium]